MKKRSNGTFGGDLSLFSGFLLVVLWATVVGSSVAGAAERQAVDAKKTERQAPPRGADVDQRAKSNRRNPVKRVGSLVGLNSETVDQYVILHKSVWPEVLDRIRKSNIQNYSIYMGELDDGNLYLFSYFEYVGEDFEADMQAMADDPITRQWWKLTDPLQKRVRNTPTGQRWKALDEVFHTD